MAQIGTDHDQGLITAPQAFQYLGDRFGRCLSNHQRNQLEISQQALQEGQLYLQAVFHRMGLFQRPYLGQVIQAVQGLAIQRDIPQGGVKGIGAAGGQSVKSHPVCRAKQHHAANSCGVGA